LAFQNWIKIFPIWSGTWVILLEVGAVVNQENHLLHQDTDWLQL
jgi:hypothetical protein